MRCHIFALALHGSTWTLVNEASVEAVFYFSINIFSSVIMKTKIKQKSIQLSFQQEFTSHTSMEILMAQQFF